MLEARYLAKKKLQSGSEPPWAWYQYMKLVETADAILAGIEATTGGPRGSDQRPETHLQLVGSTDQRDSAQPHPDVIPVQLPM